MLSRVIVLDINTFVKDVSKFNVDSKVPQNLFDFLQRFSKLKLDFKLKSNDLDLVIVSMQSMSKYLQHIISNLSGGEYYYCQYEKEVQEGMLRLSNINSSTILKIKFNQILIDLDCQDSEITSVGNFENSKTILEQSTFQIKSRKNSNKDIVFQAYLNDQRRLPLFKTSKSLANMFQRVVEFSPLI